jgi:hypothetical protein
LRFTLKVAWAGEPSTLPASSIARTCQVCFPLPTRRVAGEVQPANGSPSSEHSNRACSSAEKESETLTRFLRVLSFAFGA